MNWQGFSSSRTASHLLAVCASSERQDWEPRQLELPLLSTRQGGVPAGLPPARMGRDWEEWWLQDSGVFSKKTESKGMQEQMLSNPDMMTNLMKQNLTGIVPQVQFTSWPSVCMYVDGMDTCRHAVPPVSQAFRTCQCVAVSPQCGLSCGYCVQSIFSVCRSNRCRGPGRLRWGTCSVVPVRHCCAHPAAGACTPALHALPCVHPNCLQIAMGTFVNYFFSGFIMGKIPFPLSPSFRLMLQVSQHSFLVCQSDIMLVSCQPLAMFPHAAVPGSRMLA